MKYIQCPEVYNPYQTKGLSVFLAGGISGCGNWQHNLAMKLRDTNLVVINPRRAQFDTANAELAEAQITWEYNHLRLADIVSFWFTRDTVQPITLFELGSQLSRTNQRLVVGCDPLYERVFDVKTQLKLRRPEIVVVDNLDDLATQIKAYA